MTHNRLRLLAALAAVVAAIFVIASWNGRRIEVTPVTTPDLTTRTTAALVAVRQTIGGITDAASANASMPVLRQQSAQLIDLRDSAEKLPPADRSALAGAIRSLLAELDAAIASALKLPGVDDVAGPLLRQIAERAKALAKG